MSRYPVCTVKYVQYIPRNMHTVFALLCFVVVIHWLIFPYPSGLLHWHCGNLTIAPVPAKQPWWIWINTSCEFIMNDCITTTKQSTTKPCAYLLGYTVIIFQENKHCYWALYYAQFPQPAALLGRPIRFQFIIMTSSNGNIFWLIRPLCWEFTSHWWIHLTKVSDTELWSFLRSAPE